MSFFLIAFLVCPVFPQQAESVQKHVEALSEEDLEVRENARKALVKMGRPAVAPLQKMKKKLDQEGQAAVDSILDEIFWQGRKQMRDLVTRNDKDAIAEEDQNKSLREMFPEIRVFRVQKIGKVDIYVIRRYEPKALLLTELSSEKKMSWLVDLANAHSIALRKEEDVKKFVPTVSALVGSSFRKAACIRNAGCCGGATEVKVVEDGWEYYSESCGRGGTYHTIWKIQTRNRGSLVGIIRNPKGKKFDWSGK